MVRETSANAARDWRAACAEDLLPVEYFPVVFTLPAEVARLACANRKALYGLLFKGEPMKRQWSERHWRAPRR
jgi:hypothetical protein